MLFTATVQAVVILLIAAVWAWMDPAAGVAAGYGGAGALINTGLLLWRMKQGEADLHCEPERHLRSFYRSSMERFFVVGVWLAVGLGGIGLAALPLLTGFVIGLLAWVIAAAVWK